MLRGEGEDRICPINCFNIITSFFSGKEERGGKEVKDKTSQGFHSFFSSDFVEKEI